MMTMASDIRDTYFKKMHINHNRKVIPSTVDFWKKSGKNLQGKKKKNSAVAFPLQLLFSNMRIISAIII
jgi:hypothetical protein